MPVSRRFREETQEVNRTILVFRDKVSKFSTLRKFLRVFTRNKRFRFVDRKFTVEEASIDLRVCRSKPSKVKTRNLTSVSTLWFSVRRKRRGPID